MPSQRYTIYCHTNKVNGKKYVGQTVQTLQARWRQHRSSARRGEVQCEAFYNALRQYGADTFTHEELEVVWGKKEANTAETNWIARLKSQAPDGYNIESGGGFYARQPCTIEKMRVAMRDPIRRALIDAKVSAAWTPERRKEQSERSKRQNEINAEKLRESTRRWFAGLTEEQRRRRSDTSKTIRAAQLEASTHEQRSAAARQWLANKTPEQRSERVRKAWANRTPEQREAALSKSRASRIATLNRIHAARRAAKKARG